MKKAPVAEADQPGLPEPPKTPARSTSDNASIIASEVFPNPSREALAELRDLFRSDQFNRTDELDAYASDFRTFRDLGSIVTADMRHQMERQLCPTGEPTGSHRPITVTGSAEQPAIKTGHPDTTEPSGRAHPIRLTPELCLLRLPRPNGCHLCRDACPFGALQDTGDGIDIDHRLCQACGACEGVCPTGALELRDPAFKALLSRMQKDLAGRGHHGEPSPTLVIHEPAMRTEGSTGVFNAGGEPVLWFEVDNIGRIGVEVLLAAVAWGAFHVAIWLPLAHSTPVKASLQRHVRMAQVILAGLGQPAGRVTFAEGITPRISASQVDSVSPGHFAPPEDKRTLLRLAVRHLLEQGSPPAPWVDLPQGSPYGAVRVSAEACTFCMACAGVCPTGALSGGQGLPCLRFVEARCVQCGLCAGTCPEQAITLAPRLLFDLGSAESARVLLEDAPFACIRCGTPFASHRMIERMASKLEGHWMYRRPEDLRRLQMCAPCRVRDLYRASGGGS